MLEDEQFAMADYCNTLPDVITKFMVCVAEFNLVLQVWLSCTGRMIWVAELGLAVGLVFVSCLVHSF